MSVAVPAPPPAEVFSDHPHRRSPAVIADANALISDAMRRTRTSFTAMTDLSQRKVIRLIAPEHIDEKVYARLPRACASDNVDLTEAIRAYETVYRPHLTLVRAGSTMLHDTRVREVARADEEDVPAGQLGVLLAPALILTQTRTSSAPGSAPEHGLTL